jgi:hypothetical protein
VFVQINDKMSFLVESLSFPREKYIPAEVELLPLKGRIVPPIG